MHYVYHGCIEEHRSQAGVGEKRAGEDRVRTGVDRRGQERTGEDRRGQGSNRTVPGASSPAHRRPIQTSQL
jgi:hypothetical protein